MNFYFAFAFAFCCNFSLFLPALHPFPWTGLGWAGLGTLLAFFVWHRLVAVFVVVAGADPVRDMHKGFSVR